MAFVLDASVSAVWALTDETHPLATRALERLAGESAVVPPVWWYEVRNVLVIGERRKRLTAAESGEFLRFLRGFPIETDQEREEDVIFDLARRYGLSFYDAAYLELALRERLPLATLDRALREAAEAAGVGLLA